MNKILLIELNTFSISEPSLGLEYIRSYVKKYSKLDYEIKIRKFLPGCSEEAFTAIKKSSPSVIGISMYCWNRVESIELAQKLQKEFKDIRIVAGGPSVSVDILSGPDCFAVWDDGESSFKALLDHFRGQVSLESIRGISYLKDGKIINRYKKDLIMDMDSIPPPYSGENNLDWAETLNVETFRGCIYRCSYCNWSSIHSGVKLIRNFSFDYLEGIFEKIFRLPKLRELYIVDSNFNLDQKRALKILKIIDRHRGRKKILIGLHIDIDNIGNDFIIYMKNTKTDYLLSLAVQSTDKTVLNALNRRDNISSFRNILPLLNKYRIKYNIDVMYAMPYDNIYKQFKTYKFIYQNADNAIIMIFHTLVANNTSLYKDKDKYSLKTADNSMLVIESSTQTFQDILKTKVFSYQSATEKTVITKTLNNWN